MNITIQAEALQVLLPVRNMFWAHGCIKWRPGALYGKSLRVVTGIIHHIRMSFLSQITVLRGCAGIFKEFDESPEFWVSTMEKYIAILRGKHPAIVHANGTLNCLGAMII